MSDPENKQKLETIHQNIVGSIEDLSNMKFYVNDLDLAQRIIDDLQDLEQNLQTLME